MKKKIQINKLIIILYVDIQSDWLYVNVYLIYKINKTDRNEKNTDVLNTYENILFIKWISKLNVLFSNFL